MFKEIHKNERKSKLLIVGDGPERKKLEILVKKIGLENNVVFLGNCGNANEILQAIDVFVMPSKCEGFGISLLEAQTAGIKCFTSKDVVPNEIQIQDNDNLLEFISLKENEKEWAKKILKWNFEYERKDMYSLICKNGYDLQSNIKAIQNQYVKIWGEINQNEISSI